MKRQFVMTAIIVACFSLSPTLHADAHHPQHSIQGITYVNGGIGYEEAEWFEANAKQYALRLMFSEGQCGRALTDIAVNIQDKTNSTVFSIDNAGPQLLLNLPKGQYKVTATPHAQAIDSANVEAQGARFSIKQDSHKKIVLNWKNCVEEDSLDLPE